MGLRKVIAFSILLLIAVPPVAVGAEGHAPAATAEGKVPEGKVEVHSHLAFTFKVPRGTLSPAQRGSLASKALQASIDERETGDVEFELSGDQATFRVGQRVLFVLTAQDAAAEGEDSLARFSERRRAELNTFLKAERRRAMLQNAVLSVSLAVLLACICFLLLRQISLWAQRLREWLESEEGGSSSLKVIFAAEKTRWLSLILIRGGQVLAQASLLYAFLLGTFSLFEATRAWREQLTTWATLPFAALAERISAGLPTLLLVLFVLAVVQAGWHAITVTSDRISHGRVKIAGISPRMVAPVRLLVRAALVLATLLLLVPLVTGDSQSVLTRIGFLLLQVVGVSLIPVFATVAAGLRAQLGNHYQLGDWVQLWDGTRGEVCGIDLFHVRLVPDEGGQLLVPHLLTLVRPMRHLTSAPPLEVRIPVPGSTPAPLAAVRLREAASAFVQQQGLTGRPTVELIDVQPEHAVFRIDITGAPHTLKGDLLLVLTTALLPGERASLERTGT